MRTHLHVELHRARKVVLALLEDAERLQKVRVAGARAEPLQKDLPRARRALEDLALVPREREPRTACKGVDAWVVVVWVVVVVVVVVGIVVQIVVRWW